MNKNSNETACLKNCYRNLQSTKIPSFSGNDQLDDWIEELIETDAFIAGSACSVLGGEKISSVQIPEINSLRKGLDMMDSKNNLNKGTLDSCKSYLNLLEQVHEQIMILSE